MKFFVVCPGGLEAPLAQELQTIAKRPEVKAMGDWVIDPAPANTTGGIGFSGPVAAAMAVNLHSRIASRCLLQLAHATYRKEDDVYKAVRGLAWEEWFTPDQTLRVDVTAHRSPLTSLNFVTLRIKDAVCDRLREVKGARPSIDTEVPDVRVQAHLTATHVTVYLDTSGQSLFKRGWRDEKGAAPLKENLAAGILALTGWTPEQPLMDPMCGSGTFLIEAAYKALDIPPGAIRAGLLTAVEPKQPVTPEEKPSFQGKFVRYRPTRVDLVKEDQGFGFQRLLPFQQSELQHQWQAIANAAKGAMRIRVEEVERLQLAGGDVNEKMIQIFKSNWKKAGLPTSSKIFAHIRQIDALEHPSPFQQSGVMLFNPPYGERLELQGGVQRRGARDALPKNNNSEEFIEFLNQFGQHLKNHYAGWQIDVLTADMGLPGQLRMKESKRTPLFNGPLECRLFRFEIRKASD